MRAASSRLLVLFYGVAAVAAGVGLAARQQAPSAPGGAAATITADRILGHVKALAADEMEGRAPGTVGETRTVAYLVDQFKRIGLEPGNPDGTYVQPVPLMAFTGTPTSVVHDQRAAGRPGDPGRLTSASRGRARPTWR